MKSEQLGINVSTATQRLYKNIMFDLVCRCKSNKCFRCKQIIEKVEDFSIDHKIDWLHSDNPNSLFFDLSNISFSHKGCNYRSKRCKHVLRSKTGYKGVEIAKRCKTKPYIAKISNGAGKKIHLGMFATAKEAAEAYDRKALEMFGNKAVTNKMMGLLK
jgi:hypothetical protein